MMKPPEDAPAPVLVPIPRQARSLRSGLPFAGFIALVAVHEGLGCVTSLLWYHAESFVAIQTAWYCVWEAVLLAYFMANHFRIGSTLGIARLWAFWAVQAVWFALGLWFFAVLFVDQPFAVEGVGGWLVGAYLLAALSEGLGRAKSGRIGDDRYFAEVFKRPWSND